MASISYRVEPARCSDEMWDRLVTETGGGVFHSSAWARVVNSLGAESVPLFIYCGERLAGLAMGAAYRSRLPVLGRFRDSLAFETTPLIRSGYELEPVLRGLLEYSRKQRFSEIEIGTTDSTLNSLAGVPKSLKRSVRLEFRVTLRADHEETLSSMSSGHRRNIRKARSEGLSLQEESSIKGASALRDLQDETFLRRADLGHSRGRAWERDSYMRTMEAYLEAGVLRFWFAEKQGEKLSGMGVLGFGERAYYLVGGTSSSGYSCRAAFFLFDRVMQSLGKAGFTTLNLGGIPEEAEKEEDEDHGLYRFKAGFGSQTVRLATLTQQVGFTRFLSLQGRR